jgi:hypothetical protein
LEHWADDVSEDIAQEVQTRCDIAGEPVPEHLETSSRTTPRRRDSWRSDWFEVHYNCCCRRLPG